MSSSPSRTSTTSRSPQSFFSNTDEMYAKLGTDGGDYDISFPISVDVPKMVEGGVIAKLDPSFLTNIGNLGAEWADPGTTPATSTRSRTCGGRRASATTRRAVKEKPTSSKALWDPRFEPAHRDARRLAGGVRAGADPARAFAPTPRTTPTRRGAGPPQAAEAAGPDLLDRHDRDDDLGRRLGRPHLGGTSSPIQEAIPDFAFFIPEEGGVKGSDTVATFTGSPHPIASQMFINHLLDAQNSALEHQPHLLHGPERGGEGVHPSGDPERPDDQPRPGDHRQARGAARASAGPSRRVPVALDRAARLTGRVGAAPATARGDRRCHTRSIGAPARRWLVLPGVGWLIAFFLVPLAIILVVSLGSRNDARPHHARRPQPRQLRRGVRPGLPADVPQLAPLRGDHDDPVPRHRLPRRVLDLSIRRAAQGPAAHPRDAPVLDELPDPDLLVDRSFARQRCRELAAPDDRADPGADHPHEHGPLGDPRDDVRLPAVRDPAAVRLDRPARSDSWSPPDATCTPAGGPRSST